MRPKCTPAHSGGAQSRLVINLSSVVGSDSDVYLVLGCACDVLSFCLLYEEMVPLQLEL